MLAAGKPVVVPAGCWLADQISEPIFCHLEKLQLELPVIERLHESDLTWHAEGPDARAPLEGIDRLPFTDSHAAVAELRVPESATELLVSFRRRESESPGSYVHVQTEQWDACDNLLKHFDTVIGRRTGNSDVLTLHRLESAASRLSLRLSNAYAEETLSACNLNIQFLNSRATGGCPAGSVGLNASSHMQIPGLLQEMTKHYGHYRDSAKAFSRRWCRDHRPERAIEIMTANAANPSTPDTIPAGMTRAARNLVERTRAQCSVRS